MIHSINCTYLVWGLIVQFMIRHSLKVIVFFLHRGVTTQHEIESLYNTGRHEQMFLLFCFAFTFLQLLDGNHKFNQINKINCNLFVTQKYIIDCAIIFKCGQCIIMCGYSYPAQRWLSQSQIIFRNLCRENDLGVSMNTTIR